MLIGIDMLGVQSPETSDREAGRYGRQLVEGLIARDHVNRYVLYTHEGLPVDRVPAGRNALRVSLAPVPSVGSSRLRPTIQRLLDLNPDGLDWMVLLDPFEQRYGALPPERPLNRLKVAAVVHDLAAAIADDRVLAPLRRHDAILAVAESTAVECRKRLGQAAGRVSTIGVACGEDFASAAVAEPLTRVSGDELGRIGIHGPFLFASLVGGAERSNLLGILDAYHRLPIEHRRRHRLVIAGRVPDPAAVRAFLYDRGCDDGLVLAGEVSEASLRILLSRCSAFLSPSIDEGSGQSLVEAMRCGAAVVAGRTGDQDKIVGNAGLLVDPSNPSEIAAELAALLGDADQMRELRHRARHRSTRYSWTPVVEAVVSALHADLNPATSRRLRFDRSHAVRPRIAVFPTLSAPAFCRVDLAGQVPTEWRQAFNVDLYLDTGAAGMADGLPPEFGGFDERLFDRNDRLIGYHAVVYRFGTVAELETKLAALGRRPGLVFLEDDEFLDRVDAQALATAEGKAQLCDARSDEAIVLLREVFATGSRLVVRSPYHRERITSAISEYAGQVVEMPPTAQATRLADAERLKARARLDILPETLVIGQFGGPDALIPAAESLIGTSRMADMVLLEFDNGSGQQQASRLIGDGGAGEIEVGMRAPVVPADLVAALDLAVHWGEPGSVKVLDLLKAGVPTVAIDTGFPETCVRAVPSDAGRDALIRAVGQLAADPLARQGLSRSALAFLRGTPDASLASRLLLDEIETCASELTRSSGRRLRRPAAGSNALAFSPHHNRQPSATATDPADTRRGDGR